MNNITLSDIEEVVTNVVQREFRTHEASIDERFNEVLNAIGEEHETLLAAIGSHTVRIEDHEQRVSKLENAIAS